MDLSRTAIVDNKILSYANNKGEKIVFRRTGDISAFHEGFYFTRPKDVSEMEIHNMEIPSSTNVFENLPHLKILKISNCDVPSNAFRNCFELETVILDRVKIGHESFARCSKIKGVSLDNVISVRNDSFDWECFNDIEHRPDGMVVYDGWLVDCDEIPHDGNLVIGADIRGIAGDIFENITLNSVFIKGPVINIGPKAFKKSGLDGGIQLRYKALRFIGQEAFAKTNINKLDCGFELADIECSAFYSCKNLSEVYWDGRTIPERTFMRCENLERVFIGNKTVSIENLAFAFCRSLKAVYVPQTVTYIGAYAFAEMEKVDLQIPPHCTMGFRVLNYTDPKTVIKDGNLMIGDWLYKSHFALNHHGEHIERIVLQDYVTGILPDAFEGITIDDLFLSPNTTAICPEALKGTDLKKLHGTTSLSAVPAELFRECPNLADIDIFEDTELVQGFSNVSSKEPRYFP